MKATNTLRPRQNGRHFADDMFKWIFLNENVWIPIEISQKFVPKGSFNNNPALFQIMAWRRPGDEPLSETMMVSSLTHICVTRPQWVNWPALRAGLLCCNFFGQPGSVSKFPPFLWVKLWVGWVGRGYTEISRYFPASWINWVTLVTKIKLLYSLRF